MPPFSVLPGYTSALALVSRKHDLILILTMHKVKEELQNKHVDVQSTMIFSYQQLLNKLQILVKSFSLP